MGQKATLQGDRLMSASHLLLMESASNTFGGRALFRIPTVPSPQKLYLRAFPLKGGGSSGPYGPGSMDPTGPKVDPGPYVGEEPPSKPDVNEVELEKAAALLKKVVP
jgi:hypothetical protein